jgi:hypothetical protein
MQFPYLVGSKIRIQISLRTMVTIFPNDLSIAISELLSSMNSTGIEVNQQAVVPPAAAPAVVGSVTFKNYRHAFSTVRNLRTLHQSGA